jgi:hypothetical protein
MLAVLGGLADVERDLIRTRTAEGRSRAKAQGGRDCRVGDTGLHSGMLDWRGSRHPWARSGYVTGRFSRWH